MTTTENSRADALTDEQILREFYIHTTIADDAPLFTFDRQSALKCARTILAAFPVEQPAPAAADERMAFDILAHLQRQREFSERTFGPGARTAGVCDHIRKELKEIEANPGDLTEWIDVVILALDGAWRAGGSPQQIIDAIVAKQTKNERRTWPDWRTVPADKAIEHDRSHDGCPQCHGKGTVVFRDPEEAWDVTCGACDGSGQARAASANETAAEAVAIPPIMYNGDTKRDPALRELLARQAQSHMLADPRGDTAPQPPAQADAPETPRYREWRHLREHGEWSNGVPDWAKAHDGRMNDFTAACAVIDELASLSTRAAGLTDKQREAIDFVIGWYEQSTIASNPYREHIAALRDLLQGANHD